MSIVLFISGLALASGCGLIISWNSLRHPTLDARLAPYVGNRIRKDFWSTATEKLVALAIFNHPKTPWGNHFAIDGLLKVSGLKESFRSFRIRQLAAIAIAFCSVVGWISLRSLVHKPISLFTAVILVSAAIAVGGWIPVWRLEQLRNKRSEHVDAVLPVFLELMAFAVGAGESLLAAMKRAADEISGPFALEIHTTVLRIQTGENLSDALKNLNKQFSNISLARATRTLDMAIDRGTPIAEVLRAQASDARAAYSRNLMILAGKKEAAMLLPVVFFILPMIVAVAIYPGLVALEVL